MTSIFTELLRRFDGFVRGLGSRAAQRWTIFGATLLAATSIGPHRVLDDYVLALIARGEGKAIGLPRGELDLFTFTTGDPAGNHRLMDVGLMLPWWTDPHLRISFFRPLSSATHWLDERLWPSSAALMHAHSLLWFAALLAAVAAVYRALEESPVLAGFALLLYAVDDAHGPAIAWLANRNALIAATFGCLALVAHDAWRRQGRRVFAVAAPVAFLAGLLAGELAIGVLAYLVAYAALVDKHSLWRRVLSITPYGVVLVVWRVLWSRGGYGARGSGAYLDPLADPAGFLAVLPSKFVVLFEGQFGALPSDLAFLSPPAQQPVLIALAVMTVGVVGWLLWPIVRSDARSRFWALGMFLALVPLGATFPSDRLLIFVGLGGMALLARLFESWIGRAAHHGVRFDLVTGVTVGLIGLHLVAAPLLLPVRAAQMELFGVAHDRGAEGVPHDEAVKDRTVVIVAAPTLLLSNYIQAQRELTKVPRPKHLYVLASASSPLDVERTSEQSLTLRPAQGFLYTPLERHYRGTAKFAPNDRVALSTMTAEVTELEADGRPGAVRFSFDRPLSEYIFLKWSEGRFVPFELPTPASHVSLPEEDFGKILAAAALEKI